MIGLPLKKYLEDDREIKKYLEDDPKMEPVESNDNTWICVVKRRRVMCCEGTQYKFVGYFNGWRNNRDGNLEAIIEKESGRVVCVDSQVVRFLPDNWKPNERTEDYGPMR